MYSSFLEHIILSLGDFFNKSSYVSFLQKWRNIDSMSEEALEKLQEENLKKILQHATKNIPFYKSTSLKVENPYEWLEQFPILTKEILKKSNAQLLNPTAKKLIQYSSSGSSGIQSTIYMNKKEQSAIRAILTHWWEWSGYKMGKPLVQTGITPNRGFLKSLKDVLFRTIYISAFSHSTEEIDQLCKRLNNTSNYYLAGYASSLHVIAAHALANNYNLHLKAVISFGDKLFNHYKKDIEEAFHCMVFDTYGCNEGFLIAAQKDLEFKYIMTPHVYLEILDDNNKPVKDGVMGHVVVTRLDGYSMPLIRYKIGDLAIKLPKEEYPTEREFMYPLLQKIIGRETDIIALPNGKKMVVHAFTGIFEYIPEIKQFQVVQDELNAITINYIRGENFGKKVLTKVSKEIHRYIQDETFSIIFYEVDYIASSKSGKPQIIVNHIK